MKIIADENMSLLAETFGRHGEVIRLNGREIRRNDLARADVLLVRSVTRVDRTLLQGTGVRFVGSATIGIDHLDTDWLDANDIPWANAPGCNADAAAQFALAMILLACERLQIAPEEQTVGIIGRGNVGGRLAALLAVLGIQVMACDPPLQEQGEAQLVSLEAVCANSIISLHVPLTTTGRHPTAHLFNPQRLETLQNGALLVNTSRGGVIDARALLRRLQAKRLHAALDVWPHEPYIDQSLLDAVSVATPHVAGYSREGKQAGTEMVYRAFCRAFALEPGRLPLADEAQITLDFPPSTQPNEALTQAVRSSCPVARDDASLRTAPLADGAGKRIRIDGLRAAYPQRREFKAHRLVNAPDEVRDKLARLGFRLD